MISDNRGDGMCCDHGDGFFALLLNQKTLLESDGRFHHHRSFSFVVKGQQIFLRGSFQGRDLSLSLDVS